VDIEIKLDPGQKEPRLVIIASAVTREVEDLMKRLGSERPSFLAGFRGDAVEMLDPQAILRVYAANQRVFCVTEKGEYALRLRLYELEDRLDKSCFLRISHSEIVNLKKVRRFDLSLSGTICVVLADGTTAYASRRYVSKIKDILGI